jgi:energy-coupling factor transporter ATP-binding protein EcfA2
MMHATYVIGAPGAGKTTLIDHLTRALPVDVAEQPFAHRSYDCGVLEIGRRRKGGFSGTDALAMSVQPQVQQLVEGVRPKLLLAEGDRLANAKFFDFLIGLGYDLTVYVLDGPKVVVQRGLRGSDQEATWLEAGARLAALEEQMTDPVSTRMKEARGA